MSELNSKVLIETVLECLELHMRSSKDWQYGDPAYENDEIPHVEGVGGLRELVMRQHWTSFRLHYLRKEGSSPTRVGMFETKMVAITEAVNEHMAALLDRMGHDRRPAMDFGAMLAELSELSLRAYHRIEEARVASTAAAHAPEDVKCARKAERLMEKVGEVNTLRMVKGRELLDALFECSGSLAHECPEAGR